MHPDRLGAALATTWPVAFFNRCPIRIELWLHALVQAEIDPALVAAAARLLDAVRTLWRDRC